MILSVCLKLGHGMVIGQFVQWCEEFTKFTIPEGQTAESVYSYKYLRKWSSALALSKESFILSHRSNHNNHGVSGFY